MNGGDLIRTEGLTRRFGKIAALEQLSLTVAPGRVLGVFGPADAGKTTLLQLMAGLLRPTSGTVMIAGMDGVRQNAAVRRVVGYVPQLLSHPRRLTVREQVAYYAAAHRLPRKKRAQWVDKALGQTETTALANQWMDQLGEAARRRVAIAEALVHDPQIVLLDDPAHGLPQGTRLMIYPICRQLAAAGKTVVVTGRTLDAVIDVCDSVALLADGRLRAFGEAPHVLHQFSRRRLVEVRMTSQSTAAAVNIIKQHMGETTQVVAYEPIAAVRFTVECADHALSQLNSALVAAGLDVSRFAEIEQELESDGMQVGFDNHTPVATLQSPDREGAAVDAT